MRQAYAAHSPSSGASRHLLPWGEGMRGACAYPSERCSAVQPRQHTALQASRRLAPSAARPNVVTSTLAARFASTALGRAALGPTCIASRGHAPELLRALRTTGARAHWRTTAASKASDLIARQTRDLRSNPESRIPNPGSESIPHRHRRQSLRQAFQHGIGHLMCRVGALTAGDIGAEDLGVQGVADGPLDLAGLVFQAQ